MLKLEKKLYSRECTVTIRRKPDLWSRDLALAFVLTLCLHGVLLFLFRVIPFRIGPDETIFPPAFVTADWEANKDLFSATVPLVQETRRRDRLEPRNRVLQMPALPQKPPSKALDLKIAANPLSNDPFQYIENELLIPDFPVVFSSTINEPVSIHIAGPLASREWRFPSALHTFSLPFGEYMARFAVQVEDRTGLIFWYAKNVSSGNKDADAIAERLLEQILFQEDPASFTTSGEIEIVIRKYPEMEKAV